MTDATMLGESGTAWLGSGASVGGGDDDALRLLPELRASGELRAPRRAPLGWALAAVCAERATITTARAAALSAEKTRRGASSFVALRREVGALRSALRSMLVRSAGDAGGALGAGMILAERCGELIAEIDRTRPHLRERVLRLVERHALTDAERATLAATNDFELDFTAVEPRKLAELFLHLNTLLGAGE